MSLDTVYTLSEAAELLGVTEGTIRYYIRNGILKEGIDYRKSGRITLVTKEAIEKIK